jgi:hypothetical protein
MKCTLHINLFEKYSFLFENGQKQTAKFAMKILN